jgi:hypothetical protein
MPAQLTLRFSATTLPRLHSLFSRTPPARQLDVSYATVTRWLPEFRTKGLFGLFPGTHYPREPYTPEKVIVTLVAYKCFAPKVSARELVQIIQHATATNSITKRWANSSNATSFGSIRNFVNV